MSLTFTIKDMDQKDKDLVAEFLSKHKVTKCPPSGLSGNEQSRATQDLIALRRREFRANRKKK